MYIQPETWTSITSGWREPNHLSSELLHYARIEGLDPAQLRPVRHPRRRSITTALRVRLAVRRHRSHVVPSRQH
jgi:hypothetical protein